MKRAPRIPSRWAGLTRSLAITATLSAALGACTSMDNVLYGAREGTMEYPGSAAGFTYDSLGLSDADAAKANKPRLLGTDNPIYVPVNKVIEVETVGADVIHSWAMPQMGVKMDAVPGRINKTWFKATQTGVFYGQCSELCGARHAYMPIELHVVSEADYNAWLADSKKKFAAIENDATRVASK